jgi:ATP-dependent DNA helicase PIF1
LVKTGLTPVSFITGPAGSGKTTKARQIPNALLTATTGIAAINLGEGVVTIHSTLGFFDEHSLIQKYNAGRLCPTIRAISRLGIQTFVIDEVSMLSALMLTTLVDAFDDLNMARAPGTNPIGLTLVGDFAQLGPVPQRDRMGRQLPVAYSFDSPDWWRFDDRTTRLSGSYRHATDPEFLRVLTDIRQGSTNTASRAFQASFVDQLDPEFFGTTLVATNPEAQAINARRLARLSGPEMSLPVYRSGEQSPEWKHIPDPLRLKVGALVMVLENLRGPNGFAAVNGDLATVVKVLDGTVSIKLVRNDDLVTLNYSRRLWTAFDDRDHVRGTIQFMPLRLAYATTVHKSQGLTLDRVQMDLSHRHFRTPGMLYTALSRARTREGLRIVGNAHLLNERNNIHPKVREWLRQQKENSYSVPDRESRRVSPPPSTKTTGRVLRPQIGGQR